MIKSPDLIPDDPCELKQIVLLKSLTRHTDGIERISDFMGYPRSQAAHGRKPLCLVKTPFHLAHLGQVPVLVPVKKPHGYYGNEHHKAHENKSTALLLFEHLIGCRS